MEHQNRKEKRTQLLPYALLGLSIALLFFYVFKAASLKKKLVAAEENQKHTIEQAAYQQKILHIDSMLVRGEYNSAINAYNSEIGNKDIDDVSGIALRIELAQHLLKMQNGQNTDQEVLAMRDSLDSVQMNRTALPTEIRRYDSLNFALEKTKVQLTNMRRRLQNKTVGEYLAFTNTKGSQMHYVGQVKNGMANGFGVALLNTGSRYKGEWRNNQRHGEGSFYWADGEYYIGNYTQDKRNGLGTYYWPNGEKYVGQWKDDKRNGEGVFYGKDGEIVTKGIWSDDKLEQKNQEKKGRR